MPCYTLDNVGLLEFSFKIMDVETLAKAIELHLCMVLISSKCID